MPVPRDFISRDLKLTQVKQIYIFMVIGLQTSKLEWERNFSAVNLPFGSIKAEMGNVKNITARKSMENAAPLRKQHKALQT